MAGTRSAFPRRSPPARRSGPRPRSRRWTTWAAAGCRWSRSSRWRPRGATSRSAWRRAWGGRCPSRTEAAMPEQPPDSLSALVARFDSSVFDAPEGRARIRLRIKGGGEWDAEVRGQRARLVAARLDARPDAEITADASAWRELAANLGSGMDVFRAGRLIVRRNLHIGVGFLAATGGVPGPDRLRFARVRTREGRIATMEAGSGRPLLMLHGLGGTKISFLPTMAALAPEY